MRGVDSDRPDCCCPVLELRQYTLKSGRRDDLVELFDRHFVESQEETGASIVGQFRNRNENDQFVWIRGFSGMEARRRALQEFYGGPVWREHRDAANDTMIDSSNVLLLKPAGPAAGLNLAALKRPPADEPAPDGGSVIVTIHYFDEPVETGSVRYFERRVAPALNRSGAQLLGYFVSEAAENTFPALPVREGENVFAWLVSFAGEEARAAYDDIFSTDGTVLSTALAALQATRREVLDLVPTSRSLLRHTAATQREQDP